VRLEDRHDLVGGRYRLTIKYATTRLLNHALGEDEMVTELVVELLQRAWFAQLP
jgi:hypothetical protein